MRARYVLPAVAVASTLACLGISSGKAFAVGAPYEDANFHDEAFYKCVTQSAGKADDYVMRTDDLLNLQTLTCVSDGSNIVHSYEDLIYLSNLQSLSITTSVGASIDLQFNTKLSSISIIGTGARASAYDEVHVYNINAPVKELKLSGYSISYPTTGGALNFSGLSYLEELTLENLSYMSYNFASNSKLESLSISEIHPSSRTFDLSGNTSLKILEITNADLISLDVSHNTALTYLTIDNNNISSIDISNNTALKHFSALKNHISSINTSNNTALTDLIIDENNISSIDISNNTALKHFSAMKNTISSINTSNNTALESMNLYNNSLTGIDITKNTKLKLLDLGYNYLRSLNVSKNTALTELYIDRNADLSSLDISKNTALKKLHVEYSGISTLDVSKNTALEALSCDTIDVRSGLRPSADNPNQYDLTPLKFLYNSSDMYSIEPNDNYSLSGKNLTITNPTAFPGYIGVTTGSTARKPFRLHLASADDPIDPDDPEDPDDPDGGETTPDEDDPESLPDTDTSDPEKVPENPKTSDPIAVFVLLSLALVLSASLAGMKLAKRRH